MKVADTLRNNLFLKNIAILTTGAALGQLITICSTPFLTRVYTPADFGIFAVWLSVVHSISPAVCGRYEIAMMLPKKEVEAIHLLGISTWFSIIICGLFFFTILIFRGVFLGLLDAPQIRGLILLSPLMLFCFGLSSVLTYFANRHKNYTLIAKSKLTRSIVDVALKIVLGLMCFGFNGLVAGSLIASAVSIIYFLPFCKSKFSFQAFKWNQSKTLLLRKYIEYPIYNASTGLLNGITLALPVFFSPVTTTKKLLVTSP